MRRGVRRPPGQAGPSAEGDHAPAGEGASDGEAADAHVAHDASAPTAQPGDGPEPRAGAEATAEPGPEPVAEPEATDAPEPLVVAGRRRRAAAGAAPGAEPSAGAEVEPDLPADPLADGRPAALRMAGLHLRAGQHALARAQLEALAGRGRLDEDALLDLAEVRWRTGDLAGAGEAAGALLARGVEAPLALVIAAEAVSAAGRPGEARRLSVRALELVDAPLDPLFAGMPRALIWPAPAAVEAPPEASPRRSRGRRVIGAGDGAPSTASEAFAGGRAALARGDMSRAALLLGVAMRLEPGFADDVLRAVAGRDDQPMLALVRGDALRLLGREAEALEAFDRARGRSAGAADQGGAGDDGPGLFDLGDEPGS